MKKLFILLPFILFSFQEIYAQELTPAVELFFITENAPSSPIISCILTAQSQCWRSEPSPTEIGNYYLTDDYNHVTYLS
jgi:hypothetical protein